MTDIHPTEYDYDSLSWDTRETILWVENDENLYIRTEGITSPHKLASLVGPYLRQSVNTRSVDWRAVAYFRNME